MDQIIKEKEMKKLYDELNNYDFKDDIFNEIYLGDNVYLTRTGEMYVDE